MLKELKEELNHTVTENGAVAYKSTFNKCLDFFGLAGAMRNNLLEALNLFKLAFNEDELVAIRTLFYFRDVRGGQGERDIFRICLGWLANENPSMVSENLFPHVVEHGRWDDLYCLVDTRCEEEMFQYMHDVFLKDLQSQAPTLLGKWLKSENASSKETKRLATKTRLAFGLSNKDYRQSLSLLRSKINVLEVLMSTGQWDKIDFTKLPAKASMIYKTAFYKRQPVRYQEFIDAIQKGDVVVKSSTLYPYELVNSVLYKSATDNDKIYLNSAWENLPDYIGDDTSNSIAVVDVSGSMFGDPMCVSISLGIYLAERCKGTFNNHFITFHDKPDIVEIPSNLSFIEKVKLTSRARWGMNTDVKAVFNLILRTAVNNNTPVSEIPQNVYIISDMEFDECKRHDDDKALFDIIEKEWNEKGYELPRLIFWNVNARQSQFPKIRGNVTLISGLSPSIFTSTLKNLSPIDTLMDAISKYSDINI